MKKQFKRNLSILLSVAILISALSGIGITASAAAITADDLTGTEITSSVTSLASDLTYTDVVYDNYVHLNTVQNKATIGKNGTAYASSADNDSLKLTLNATKADNTTVISNNKLTGVIYTFADEIEGAKIKSFSYTFTGKLSDNYGKPVIFKGNGDKLITPGFTFHDTNYPTPNVPIFKVFTQSTEDAVTTISKTTSSGQIAYLSNVSSIKQADVNTYNVKVEYNYNEEDVCTGAKVTYTCTVNEVEHSFGMSIVLSGATFNNKDVSISGVDSAITEITPYIGFCAANLTTVNGVAETEYSNVSVAAERTVDYTNEILNFVNSHKVLIDIKNGLDCSSRKDDVAAAKAAYNALTDDNLKNLIAANGYYNSETIESILNAVSAEEIVNELNGTITMAGATVKMNQIDNNNQLRFAADYTAFNAIVEKYADRVNIVKHGIYALAGSKTADDVIKTGTSFETTVSNFATVTEDGTDKVYDYWIIGGTANYVSTKVSVVAYTTITIDNTEYTLYSDAISRSIVSVIRAILNAQEKTAVESALTTVNTSGNTEYTYDDLMTNKVGTDTDKQAFVKAVFTQFCKDADYIK